MAATRYSDGTLVRSGVTVTNDENTFTATATDALGRSASTSVSVNRPGSAAFQCDLNEVGSVTGCTQFEMASQARRENVAPPATFTS